MSPMDHRDHRDHHFHHGRTTTVLRRGQPFFMAVRMRERNFDARRDILRVCFNFGSTFVAPSQLKE